MLEAVRLSDGAFDLDGSQSPQLTGRAVVALAGDPQIMRRSGGAFAVANLARDYAFTDVDGTTPEPVDIG
jgi:hypothetical protein